MKNKILKIFNILSVYFFIAKTDWIKNGKGYYETKGINLWNPVCWIFLFLFVFGYAIYQTIVDTKELIAIIKRGEI